MDERTAHIVNLFKDSWTQTENFYRQLLATHEGWNRLNILINTIELWRHLGWDSYFRLGTSIHHLIISRSVEHGLRKDQKYIRIDCIKENDFHIVFRDGERIYREYRLTSLEDEKLIRVMETLRHTLIG